MDGVDGGDAGAAGPAAQLVELGPVHVTGDDAAAVGHGRRQRQGLAAGARAQVDDDVAPTRRRRTDARHHQLGEELAALVLGLEQAGLELGQGEQVGAGVDDEGVARPPPRRGGEAVPGQRRGQRLAGRAQAVGADGHGRPLPEGAGERLGARAPVGVEARRQPVGERAAERQPHHRVAFAGDGLVDRRHRRPVDGRLGPRRVGHADLALEQEVRDQAIGVPWRTAARATAHRGIDAPELTHHAMEGLGDEPAFVRAQPRFPAKRLRKSVADEAPVEPGALPELEQERADPAARDRGTRELPVTRLRFVLVRH